MLWVVAGMVTLATGSIAVAAQYPCTEQGVLDAVAAGGGPHTFACAGSTTIATSALITFNNNVILDGEGDLTLDGGNTHPVAVAPALYTVELRNLIVTGGYAPSGRGGGITNGGSLTLVGCTVSNNSAAVTTANDGGGGIINHNELILIDTLVTGNSAGSGAGIMSARFPVGAPAPVLSITGSTISSNDATFYGGGIYADGILTITDSDVISNTASSGYAGVGVVEPGPGGPGGDLTLTDSTIGDNEGGGLGNGGTAEIVRSSITGNTVLGGILNSGTLTIDASTISENTGISAGGILNSGTLTFTNGTLWGNTSNGAGAIYNASTGNAILENATLSGNSVGITSPGAGALLNEGNSELYNSTIAENSGPLGTIYHDATASLTLVDTLLAGDCSAFGALPTSGGGNLESPGNTCGLSGVGDQVSVSAASLALDPLADNGGLSLTHSLGATSAAVDAAVSCPPPNYDQRGFPRPELGGTVCDTGAFEVPEPSRWLLLATGVGVLVLLRRPRRQR